MIVEDGTAPEGANSYVTVDYAMAYCDARGLSFGTSPTTTGEQALIRATAALDAKYGSRYPGTKTNGREQSLLWPRTGATDAEGEEIADDEIPQEIVDAVCELAVREYAEAGSTMPDLERGGHIRRMQAGSVQIEYGNNATAETAYSIVDGILAGLLGFSGGNIYTASAVRG